MSDINAATGQTVQQDDWVPQRSWTAWPMAASKVPAPDFMGKADEIDEEYITRKKTVTMPSTALEESISATILRFAKERFQSRPWQQDELDDANMGEGISDAGLDDEDDSDSDFQSSPSKARSRSISRPIKRESETDGESADEKLKRESSDEDEKLPQEGGLRPTISTDDDLSYALLRPSVRHILSKLDDTLRTLHIFQESTKSYLSDSDDSDASDSSQFSRSPSRERAQSGAKGKRGRPRKDGRPPVSRRSEPLSGIDDDQGKKKKQSSIPKTTTQSTGPDHEQGKKATRRGRPKKTYERLEGESDRDYAIRVARIQKKPIPSFLDPDSGAEAGRESDEESPTKDPRTKRKADKELSPERPMIKKAPRDGWKNRVGLRDWRNVLGAAALAGFPPQAIDRAARRCADLFGQSMEIHTLTEGPMGQADAVKTTRYVPGMPRPSLLESDDEELPPSKARSGRTRESSTETDAMSEGGYGPSNKSRKSSADTTNTMRRRSRSASATGSHFCTFGDCPRAAEGFARRANLLRHLKLVHGSEGDAQLPPAEVDSEDDMHGGVHVDGFLKPIRVRQGWRSRDVAAEPRQRRRKRGKGGIDRSRARTGSMSMSISGTDEREGLIEENDAGRGLEEW
ncbi:hypothetical protein SLS62_001046 [Diatrype stigma]|uniref:Rrn9 domain-containing protein n=1 Tax=Diatrype stigma TaxID=117547 RepID=A0AAN9V2T3_9PEZI